MKKHTWKTQTERMEVHLVREFEDAAGQGMPHVSAYLMIGPVGGPFARVEDTDAALLGMLLTKIEPQFGYLPPPGGGRALGG